MTKILRINLTDGKISSENVDPKLEDTYIGGQGVAAAILTKEVPPQTDPFDGQNKLIFSVGPFCGTAVPFNGRHFVMAKSPLTGIIGEASAGGFFGKELQGTGYSHIIIEGKSDKPVYLWISPDKTEIRDASMLWGKTTSDTEDSLKKMIGSDDVKISSIGPAGENLVKFAGIVSEINRLAARCGLGAVMGSKKLKAIAVQGKIPAQIANRDILLQHVKTIHELVKASPMAMVYKQFGTPTSMDSMSGVGDVPIKNYTESRWGGTKNIGFEGLKNRGEIKHHACFGCPVACTGLISFKDPNQTEVTWVRWPEYETLAMLGSNIYVDNLETLVRWNILVDNLGMDTISLGGVLALFLEAVEKGKIPVNAAELGFKLMDPAKPSVLTLWGDLEGIENVIKLIAARQGIGNELAEGVRAICKKYNLPPEFDTTVKGLETPAHEPRANNMTALDYATTPRGAFHCAMPMHLSTSMNLKKEVGLDKMVDRFAVDDAAVAVKKIQDVSEAYAACNGCIFGFNFLNEITPWINSLNAITGKAYTVESWAKAGEEIVKMKRTYNQQCGTDKTADKISPRFLIPILKGGTRKNVPAMDQMLAKYYTLRGW